MLVVDSCPPPAICDRAFPFDAYVVLIAPDGSPIVAFEVVGSSGPERILGLAPDPLPPHVQALIVAAAST